MFRVEKKLCLSKYEAFILLNKLTNEGLKKIYDDRKIKSVYFDNKMDMFFQQSEDGVLPRKVIRIRNYDNKDNYYLEKKINSIEGKFKVSNFINSNQKNFYLNFGLMDSKYGICNQKLVVEYIRSYFLIKKIRITYDRKITYKKNELGIKYKDENCIIEFKTDNNNNLKKIAHPIDFEGFRNSKYCTAYKKIKRIN